MTPRRVGDDRDWDAIWQESRGNSAPRQTATVVRQQAALRPPKWWGPFKGLVVFLLVMAVLIGGIRMIAGWMTSGLDGEPGQSGGEVVAREPEPVTPELDYAGFDPGDIISDQRFFDTDTMTADDIRAFIDEWNAGCRTGRDGTPCLSDYVEDAPRFAPDDLCPGGFSGEAGDDAATIVWRAATGCGINPQVLLVTLQKEQGLITASGGRLNATRYDTAMGYACPDDGSCDGDFHGFARQMYYAARQFQRYAAYPGEYTYHADQTVAVPFAAGDECGAEEVHIVNQATANLYNYTPHQPNGDALSDVRGTCSSWGNLNFYAYFNAWFGSTH